MPILSNKIQRKERLMTYQILLGNNLDILPTLEDNSVDSIVTDPPYELGFMGKKWDSSGIAYSVELWQHCLRVLKPGGHLLSFGGTRTWHRVAVGIEDAGFEIRDSMAWLYGSGFPKSLDVSKAIDKAAGAKREVIGSKLTGRALGGSNWRDGDAGGQEQVSVTAPSTPEAKQWQGWGTALKPAFEPIVVARKPIDGTVANNVLKWGTGGLNIDGSRIGSETISTHNAPKGSFAGGEENRGSDTSSYKTHTGRWPANIILDPYTAELLDEQSGTSKSTVWQTEKTNNPQTSWKMSSQLFAPSGGYSDTGGASRFFYVAKASKRDRNEGLDELADKVKLTQMRSSNGTGEKNFEGGFTDSIQKNFHPTVKPTTLMEYLIKLVTPPGGIVLDPFAGSGSTGKAAILNGFDFIGIELTEEYLLIIEGRLKAAEQEKKKKEAEEVLKQFEGLF
jgi:DNA modification methylase